MFIERAVSADAVVDFLNEQREAARKTGAPRLAGYAVSLGDRLAGVGLERFADGDETAFYFERPEERFAFCGVGEAYAVSTRGRKRFEETARLMADLPERVLRRAEGLPERPPLFVGAVTFEPDERSDEWRDFDDSRWFVPERLILRIGEKDYLIYNALVEGRSSVERLVARFEKALEELDAERRRVVPDALDVRPVSGYDDRDRERWIEQVEEVKRLIGSGSLDKAVLARRVSYRLDSEFSPSAALARLKERFPACYVFAYRRGESLFFGASPETLLRLQDGVAYVEALAGSWKRGETPEEDAALAEEFLASEKDLAEHRFVADYVMDALREATSDLRRDDTPRLKRLPNIMHLQTRVEGRLKRERKLFPLLDRVFPTPAVCGLPKGKAYDVIRDVERQPRGLYAGAAGWFSPGKEGDFVVGIRSALVKRGTLTAFAGCGIVDASDPVKEFDETELKFQAALSPFRDEG
jgi:menaquinone-specific isochorismate synthase